MDEVIHILKAEFEDDAPAETQDSGDAESGAADSESEAEAGNTEDNADEPAGDETAATES